MFQQHGKGGPSLAAIEEGGRRDRMPAARNLSERTQHRCLAAYRPSAGSDAAMSERMFRQWLTYH
ncbi:MAG: hypothetical protein AB7T39_17075 [Alphaproteobacteria bacterium]